MANSKSYAAALAAVMLGSSACDRLPQWPLHRGSTASVTVKLPPARPQTPAPGFTFNAQQSATQDGASLNGA